MDSGNPQTLISCCKWAIENYPADNIALILWNHGTGIIDPIHGRVINPAGLFSFNPDINKFELDRTIGFLEFIDSYRGICWDSSTGSYLTNQKLEEALSVIKRDILQGRKLSLLGFDACLMSMVEICNIAKHYADVMVGSQEVELGTGWNYAKVLAPFEHSSINKYEFGKHIVSVYAQTYEAITNDYTQSAINLATIEKLEEKINEIGDLIIECLKNQAHNSVKQALKLNHSHNYCTHFDEPSYVDMHHLFSNIQEKLPMFQLNNKELQAELIAHLDATLNEAKALLCNTIIFSKTGKNLSKASGLSIYFPEQRIHSSYPKTVFAHTNSWYKFLQQYHIL
jgi:hypothetical protein